VLGDAGEWDWLAPAQAHGAFPGARGTQRAPMQLRIQTESNSRAVIVVTGEVDSSNVDELHTTAVLSVADGMRDIAFDLSGVTFIDFTGLMTLASAHDDVLDRNGRMRIAGATPTLVRLFHVTGLDRVFAIEPQHANRRPRVVT
jgi:anti-sigma B factor antagonist